MDAPERLPDAAAAAIGRRTEAADLVAGPPVAALMATLGRPGAPPGPGEAIPPLWHGLFCIPALPPEALGEDGMARDRPLLPALPGFPRRRFGGARFRFLRPIRVGERIRRVSEIAGMEIKTGRAGRFLRMGVRHVVEGPAGPATIEENDILHLPPAAGGAAEGASSAPPRAALWSRRVRPDPVLLFRHSALTFNAHRIHYDRAFAHAQGEPGLVVHAMLIARLMLELLHAERRGRGLAGFAFRTRTPLHDDGPFTICGAPDPGEGGAALWALRADGRLAMTAEAAFAD